MSIEYTASFGEKLYAWRVENNFSQNHIACILNCTRKTVSGWEKEDILPNYDSIIAVALMMHVSADWLLGISPDKTLRTSINDDVTDAPDTGE